MKSRVASGSWRDFGIGVTSSAVAVILLLLLPLPGTLVSAKSFSIPKTGVTFEAPDGFTSLTAEEIAAQYPRGNQLPSFAVGNAQRTTMIAYDLQGQNVPPDALPEIKAAMESTYEQRIPGMKWVQHDIVSMKGQKWIQLEFVTPEAEGDLHNIQLMTLLDGKMLFFNFSSTNQEFPKVEQAIRKSIRTITLRPAS